MEEFAALIQTGSGEKIMLNIDDIVETIDRQGAGTPDVVKKTLEKIQEQRLGAA